MASIHMHILLTSRQHGQQGRDKTSATLTLRAVTDFTPQDCRSQTSFYLSNSSPRKSIMLVLYLSYPGYSSSVSLVFPSVILTFCAAFLLGRCLLTAGSVYTN